MCREVSARLPRPAFGKPFSAVWAFPLTAVDNLCFPGKGKAYSYGTSQPTSEGHICSLYV